MHWKVTYRDGRELSEDARAVCSHPDGDHGDELPHVWACVEKERVGYVEWLQGDDVLTRVAVPGDGRPILFRRHVIADALGANDYAGYLAVAGWQRTNGHNEKLLCAVMLDGAVIVTDNDADLEV